MIYSSHGTRCAGEVSAARDNDVCGVGVAYDSKVAGKIMFIIHSKCIRISYPISYNYILIAFLVAIQDLRTCPYQNSKKNSVLKYSKKKKRKDNTRVTMNACDRNFLIYCSIEKNGNPFFPREQVPFDKRVFLWHSQERRICHRSIEEIAIEI